MDQVLEKSDKMGIASKLDLPFMIHKKWKNYL